MLEKSVVRLLPLDATDFSVVLDLGGDSSFVSLGAFSDVVYRNDDAKRIEWSLR